MLYCCIALVCRPSIFVVISVMFVSICEFIVAVLYDATVDVDDAVLGLIIISLRNFIHN